MKTITKSQLVSMLSDVKGTSFVQLLYVGEQKMRKTNNPFDTIIKRVSQNLSFNYSYEKAVNNRLDKKGLDNDFKSSPLAWGTWLIPNKTITHNDTIYIRFYMHGNTKTNTTYFHNGNELTGKQLENAKTFFQGHSESSKQSEAGLDESEQVKPLAIKVDNIRKITINKETYEVI